MLSTVEINETKKHYKLQEDALKEAIAFYKNKNNNNYHNIFKMTRGFNKYYIIPVDLDDNKFILISGNLKRWKFIKQINFKKYNSNEVRKVQIEIYPESFSLEGYEKIIYLTGQKNITINVCMKGSEIIFNPIDNIQYINNDSLLKLIKYMNPKNDYTIYVPKDKVSEYTTSTINRQYKKELENIIKNYNNSNKSPKINIKNT